MKKTIYNILFVIYGIVAVFTTICLLSFNQYKITEFGNYSWVLLTDANLEQDFNKGDLVILNKKSDVEVGDKIFFYNTYEKNVNVDYATVVSKEEVTKTESTYTIDGDYKVSSQYVLGNAKDSTSVKYMGTVLSFLESKWGFLFIIILPAVVMFLYEVIKVITEIRKTPKKGTDE